LAAVFAAAVSVIAAPAIVIAPKATVINNRTRIRPTPQTGIW
jgi:hypothetical protein